MRKDWPVNLGISLQRGANVRPPRFLSLLTGTRKARFFCSALFPREGGKTSIVSIRTCLVQKEDKNPLSSWPPAPAAANGKGRSFTKTMQEAKILGIHDDQSLWVAPSSQFDLPASEAD
jgi:hypothetical protein